MSFDFNKIVDRTGTNSLKYDFGKERKGRDDLIPLWVADMDFKTVPAITEKLKNIAEHGIFGYSEGKQEYFAAISNWYKTHFGWKVKQEWLIKTPGVVFAISAAIHAFTKEGDAVIIQQPVYYPFSEVIKDNNRVLVNNALKLEENHYEIDFNDFEAKIVENKVKLFVLCSPHNPVGRVWKEWELRRIGDICLRHRVIIVSDEIHSDFTYGENKHIIFASLEKEYADITITCTSPSKTFNLAGLQVSNIFISNETLRRRFKKTVAATGYSQVNTMGLLACQTAYESGEQWLIELKKYLSENLDFVRQYIKQNIPEIKMIEPEGTYLIWLDFRELKLTEKQREDLLLNKAGLWLDSGALFGETGEGFERINIACPRETLKKALTKLSIAIKS